MTTAMIPQSDRIDESASLVATIAALAANPQVDVDKLQRLMDMHDRMAQQRSKAMFNEAMSAAQQDMRPVSADANNPQTRSKYASYAALDNALRTIYTKHGFGLSFDTGESGATDVVRVLCYVSQSGGAEKTYHIDMPADGKGAKGGDVMTKTHATGAAMSYGMRYLLKMIFNVAVGEDDRDGNEPKQPRTDKKAPAGFDDWLMDLSAVAEEGTDALRVAWTKSKSEMREYLNATKPEKWDLLKGVAAQATKAAKEGK